MSSGNHQSKAENVYEILFLIQIILSCRQRKMKQIKNQHVIETSEISSSQQAIVFSADYSSGMLYE